ncbi:hypothetical protein AKJ09_08760 [Labilithrix luteola]|uniref:SCP2 domain-containing protein n=1 Tax=Labilithrix luteola TaxID=1391654 RepID=A0A0K1Q8U3_9BACT|nr:SCP2 sterol-binding domain-containing protein [Labilithrix luteola]AKV02097.1 hypothetical protein AKJ09_08760 [Labilithrix luteola]
MASFVQLAPGAEENAFAQMLADLVRQNIESKPHKKKDFDAIDGTVALVADDAEVALTLEFRLGRLVVHDGIYGVPDVAVRGSSDAIMTLSNVPLTRPLALPIPTDRPSLDVLRSMVRATRTGELKIFGMFRHMGLLNRVTRVMSVNG